MVTPMAILEQARERGARNGPGAARCPGAGVPGAASVSAVAWVAWAAAMASVSAAVGAAAGTLVALAVLTAAGMAGLAAVRGVIRSVVQTTYPIMNSVKARPRTGNRAAAPEDAPMPAIPPPGPPSLPADTARSM